MDLGSCRDIHERRSNSTADSEQKKAWASAPVGGAVSFLVSPTTERKISRGKIVSRMRKVLDGGGVGDLQRRTEGTVRGEGSRGGGWGEGGQGWGGGG